jgi:hypothetical protein
VFDPDEPTLPGGVRVLSQDIVGFAWVEAGRHAVRVSKSLLYQFDLPDDSDVYGGVYLNPGRRSGGDSIVWLTPANQRTALPVHPCRDHEPRVVGPTVGDLVSALKNQPYLTTTKPAEVTVGGVDGLFVKVSVPDDAEVAACQGSAVDIISRLPAAEEPGIVDRMWILDIDGARHVLLARTFGATKLDTRLVTRLVKSITFTHEPADTVRPPGLAGVGAVWYDAQGLHHGGVVERTPVELVADEVEGIGSVFALVRHGAVYRDPATDDVWFHPWGGRPRVVGHGSATGPGGDPESDVAAWFEGNELVVFDTARGEEISRITEEAWALIPRNMMSEHVRDSNGFVHVSPTEVVWRSENDSGLQGMSRLEVEAGTSSVVWDLYDPNEPPMPIDVHDTTRIIPLLGDGQGDPPVSLLIDAAGQEQLRLDPDSHGVEPMGRLSPDGTFVLAPSLDSQDLSDSHGAAIVDARNRMTWKLPLTDSYVWIAWSYDNLAVVKVDRDDKTKSTLLACDAATRECDRLPHQGRVLLPAS